MATLTISGRISEIMPKQEGVSKSSGNHWEKTEFAIETEGQYPKIIAFQDFNNKCSLGLFKAGDLVNVSFDVESRKWQDRYFTQLTAWKVEALGGQQPQQAAPQYQQPAQPATHQLPQNQNDLPF